MRRTSNYISSIIIICGWVQTTAILGVPGNIPGRHEKTSMHHQHEESFGNDSFINVPSRKGQASVIPMGHFAALKREEDPDFGLNSLHLEYSDHPFERRTKKDKVHRDNVFLGDSESTSPSPISRTTYSYADVEDPYINLTISPSENPATAPSMYPTAKMSQPLRITYETSEIEKRMNESLFYDNAVKTLTQSILPKVSEVWSSILSIVPVEGNITVNSKTCYGFFDVPESAQQGVPDTDLLVFVSAYNNMNNITFCDGSVLASASHCTLDQYDRPVVGFVNFCLDTINTRNEDAAVAVGVHELGHVLGFSDDLFQYFRDGNTGEPLTPRPFEKKRVTCVNGSNRRKILASHRVLKQRKDGKGIYYEIVTPKVLEVAKNHFGCPDLTGARLENQPTRRSCTGAHLDERYYFTDSMSPIFSSESVSILSPITVALMEDTGWYDVTYASKYIKNNPFGLGAGCAFLEEDNCIINDTVPENFKPFFCDTVTTFDNDGKVTLASESTCDPSYTHVAYCDLVDFSTNIPTEFTSTTMSRNNGGTSSSTEEEEEEVVSKFTNPDLGTILAQSDSCPTASLFAIDCTNPSTPTTKKLYPEEYYGSNSRCFNSMFDHPVHVDISRGVCLQSRCNRRDRTLEVYFGNDNGNGNGNDNGNGNGIVVTCKYDGQVHKFPQSKDVSFVCPPLASFCPQLFCPAMCSGRGVCNFESDPPGCECYDDNDVSPGCFGVGVDDYDDYDGYGYGYDNGEWNWNIDNSNESENDDDPSSGFRLSTALGSTIMVTFVTLALLGMGMGMGGIE